MAPIPKGGTVAVTGSAGFIGGWMVRLLLDRGYRVRACVRDVEDANKTSFLKDMPGYASGRLTHPFATAWSLSSLWQRLRPGFATR